MFRRKIQDYGEGIPTSEFRRATYRSMRDNITALTGCPQFAAYLAHTAMAQLAENRAEEVSR